MTMHPHTLTVTLPAWVEGFLCSHPECLSTIEKRMTLVIEAARCNVAEGTGGPFAAAVFEMESGRLVSLGLNLVTTGGLSILHAEIVALALAQQAKGVYDLGAPGQPAHELVTSTEPCAMCFGAIPWSGVRRVVTGARESDARCVGFDEGPKMLEWRRELENRGIATICGIEREAAAQVLFDYAACGGRIYNSREGDAASPAGG